MIEIPLTALAPSTQIEVSEAREALASKEIRFAVSLLSQLVMEVPTCLELRQLLRRAQYSNYGAPSELSLTPHQWWPAVATRALQRPSLNPYKGLTIAERWLGRNPYNVMAHRRLAQNAYALKMTKTVVFANECINRHQPDITANQMDLAQAYLDAGDTQKAIAMAEKVLYQEPENHRGIELVQSCSLIASLQD